MQQEYCFNVDENKVKDISKSIAIEVANRIFYEFLLARYIPEILAIENGGVVPIKTEAFKKQIAHRIKSMAE